MDFSVLMAVYAKDDPDYFKTALESVTINQTLKPNQVVIVFDGPVSDRFEKIINSIKETDDSIIFTIVKLDLNSGLAAALNAGLNECICDYVARMDSDDIAVPERFSKQISYLEKHKNIDVLGGLLVEFEEDPNINGAIRRVGYSHEDIIKMAKRRTPFNHMTVIYKKSKVLDVGGYNVSYGKLEDYKLWVDLITSGCCLANLKEILIKMRIGNGLIGRRSNKREIVDWDHLQNDLIRAGLINGFEAFLNRIYIRIFTYMPSWMKKLAYKIVLRENGSKL